MHAEQAPQHLALHPRSITRYLAVVLGLGVPLLAIPGIVGETPEAFIFATQIVLLVGAVLAARRSGTGGVRGLFGGVTHWRIGWVPWAQVTLAIPVTAIAVAAATGTLQTPSAGWPAVIGTYLLFTFVIGTLLLNLWEEVSWQGLVQRHLVGRHGLLKGAMLTAVPFAILHVPLQVGGVTTFREGLLNVGLLFVLAPALRYLLGRLDFATGSLLAVGVLHASFNASGAMEVLEGGWQHIVAAGLLAVAALVVDRVRWGSATPVRGTPDAGASGRTVRGSGAHGLHLEVERSSSSG